jgi:hypothetical protein
MEMSGKKKQFSIRTIFAKTNVSVKGNVQNLLNFFFLLKPTSHFCFNSSDKLAILSRSYLLCHKNKFSMDFWSFIFRLFSLHIILFFELPEYWNIDLAS